MSNKSSHTIIITLQADLEKIYHLSTGLQATDYLVTPQNFLTLYPDWQDEDLPQELLLINSHKGDHDLGLFIHPQILATLAEYPPQNGLARHNLEAFLTVVEGVSHFVYLVQRIQRRQPATQLEMELQAEIDKYLFCLIYGRQGTSELPHQIVLKNLFARYTLHGSLTAEQRDRYHLAHRLGFQFCQKLAHRCRHLSQLAHALQELRDFFRGGLIDKLHAVAS